jgi:hypothetical protein
MRPFISNLSPARLEALLDFHFNLLFNRNDSVVIQEGSQSVEFLRCAVSEKGWGILIELNTATSPYSRPNTNNQKIIRGNIRLEEAEISIEGRSRQFISIYCRRAGLLGLFIRLMADIIWHLLSDGPQSGDPWVFISERLSGWRLLFSATDTKAQEKGLLGELLILKHLMETYGQPVTIWTGPLGGVKDFRLQDRNIEVKTTSVRYGYLIEISGLFQTEIHQASENLAFIRIEETPNGRYSVRDLILELQRICVGETAQGELRNRLEDFCDEILGSVIRWDVLEAMIIDVDTNFPRIARENFVTRRLPDGIVKIQWTADLAGLKKIPLMEYNFLT